VGSDDSGALADPATQPDDGGQMTMTAHRTAAAEPGHTATLSAAALRASGGSCTSQDLFARPRRPRRRDRDEGLYERWLARQTQRLDPLMAFLSIVFTLLVAFQFAEPRLSTAWARALEVSTWFLWGMFVVDFVAKVIAAPSATRFLRRHWLTLVMLLIPTLRFLRFAALLRIGRALPAARVLTTSYRATGVARGLLRSRTSFLAAMTGVSTLAVAELGWLVERGRGSFESFGDALLWSASAVVGMQADPVPQSVAGRLLMLAAFAVGLVVVATLAGTVGAYLLEERRERAWSEEHPLAAGEPPHAPARGMSGAAVTEPHDDA
jgi:voltage-gated potassium channel